jgi:cytochrome b involved in lipid metabolism
MASDIRPLTDKKTGKARAKVALRPGFHLMDWMRLPLRPHRPRQITVSELGEHKTKFDCWTALNGKVYNITQYMEYHPGKRVRSSTLVLGRLSLLLSSFFLVFALYP